MPVRLIRRRDTRRALTRERDEARAFLARALALLQQQRDHIDILQADRDAMEIAADHFRAERNRIRRQMAMCAGMPPEWVMVATSGASWHTLARTPDQHPHREPQDQTQEPPI